MLVGEQAGSTDAVGAVDPAACDRVSRGAVRRFEATSVVAIVAAGLPYLWALWDLWTGTINPFRPFNGEQAYDVQARALLHAHITVPINSIDGLAFTHGGRSYTYFGVFPSILRMPIFLVTHSFDGRLTAPSMFGAWLVTAAFSALLLWRIRIVVRGEAPLGWIEAVSYGVLLFSILVGSVLVYLASQPNVYSEDLAWSVALACASLFALLGVVEQPSWGRLTTCCVLVLCTNLNRATTGYACIIAMVLIAGWFALGRAGQDRRRWALPMALAALVPLIAGCAIDLAKFHILFGVPISEEGLVQYLGVNHLNGGSFFGLRYLPSTLQAYVNPLNIRVTPVFPYLTLPDVPAHLIAHTQLFGRAPTAGVPPTMLLLFGAGLWGVIAAFMPHRPTVVRGLRILLVATALTAASAMIFGWVLERYVADFMPLLILASMVGMVDICRLLEKRQKAIRAFVPAVIGLLALFELVANLGLALTPVLDGWTQTQVVHYVDAEKSFSDFTGHPLSHDVVRGSFLPPRAPMGQLFVLGDCDALYIADETVPWVTWLPVERAPDTPICRSLIATAASIPVETNIVFPSKDATVSGSRLLVAEAFSGSRIDSVSFTLARTPLVAPTNLGHGTFSEFGWLLSWNTHSVPNGTYVLKSVATDAAGHRAMSSGITITVLNPAWPQMPLDIGP
jgi:hypothetical protein